jgi:anti-sigma-K factor RskA
VVAAQFDQPERVPVIMTVNLSALSKEDSVLASEYALGVLQGEARDSFARRMEQDAGLSAEVRMWDEHFVSFAEDVKPINPTKQVEAALQRRLFGADTPKPSLWNSLGFWRGFAVASLVAVMAMGTWSLRPETQLVAGKTLVAHVAADKGELKVVAHYDAHSGELRLNRIAGVATAGRSLELWLIVGNDAPVSLGVLSDVATMQVAVPVALRDKFSNGVLAVSDEPLGGSPSGAPTGAVVATGPLTEV